MAPIANITTPTVVAGTQISPSETVSHSPTPSIIPSASITSSPTLSASPSATLSDIPTATATSSASPSPSASVPAQVSIIKINAGGPNLDGYKADDMSYTEDTESKVYSYTNKQSSSAPTTVYSTHSWASDMADLIYKIPITTGASRVEVIVGYLFLPYVIRANVAVTEGLVTVRIVPKVENAFISLIEVRQTPTAPTVTGNQTATSCFGKQGPITSDFQDKFHLAHAVASGPYIETDFDNVGGALVALDASGSHSHATDPEVGRIVEYKWTWFDSNHAMAKNGTIEFTGARVSSIFPLGSTNITLQVSDQYCNQAMENTTVTVNPSTRRGAYCYTYDFGNSMPLTVPLPKSAAMLPRPQYGFNPGSINFDSLNSFGDFPFRENSFAVRCMYSENTTNTSLSRGIIHSGPIIVYCDNDLVAQSNSSQPSTFTESTPRNFTEGIHDWQVLYFRPKSIAPLLVLQFENGTTVPETIIRHDAGKILPVITSISRNTALPGEILTVLGSSFVNGAEVKFGNKTASPVVSTATSIQVRVPTPTMNLEILQITVITKTGVSNGISFTYAMMSVPCQAVSFSETSLKKTDGTDYKISDIAVIKYGPDGRLYLGSQRDLIHVLTINKNLQVIKDCSKNVRRGGPRRWILGIAFKPKSTALKMYFTTNTFNWRKFNLIQDFGEGWTNGKIESVTLNDATSCFNDDVQDVVTGLPVTNHDHGVSSHEKWPKAIYLQFLTRLIFRR